MQSTVETLDDNKVKLSVSVPADEFERAIDGAFRKLAQEVRIPGFRPGKAPRRLLEARFGSEAARDQALRDSLPEFYVQAIVEHDVDVIAPPEIEVTAGQDDGDVEFDAVVEVRPVVKLVGYDELRLEVPWKPVDDAAVDEQVDAWRERFAELAPSEHPLIDDAYATIDVSATADGETIGALSATDFLYRVGSGILVPELDEQLRGNRPGAILEFDATLPERFDDLAGREVRFRVMVKDAQVKVLPEATDEWARDNSEFETLLELRAELAQRLDLVARVQGRLAARDKALEAIAELVPIEAPETLVDQEVRRRVEEFAHELAHRGVELEQYLAMTGQEPQAFLDEVRVGAARSVLADLALRAVIAQEEIAVTDDEVAAALDSEARRIAERTGDKLARVQRELERRGAAETVRSSLVRGKALEFLVDHATVVDEEGAPVDLHLPEGTSVPEDVEVPGETDSDDERPQE